MKPVRKVRYSGTAGAATVVLVWLSAALGYPVPPEVASATVLLVMSLVAYLTRPEPPVILVPVAPEPGQTGR